MKTTMKTIFATALLAAFLCGNTRVQAQRGIITQVKSGVVAGVSRTTHSFDQRSVHTAGGNSVKFEDGARATPLASFFAGYKLSLGLQNKWSVDAALLYHLKSTGITTPFEPEGGRESGKDYFWKEGKYRHGASAEVLLNYSLYRGLKLGVGAQPVYYFGGRYKYNDQDYPLDMPLIGRLAYDFGVFELAAAYKHGITSVYNNRFIYGTYTRDIELSVFIPLFK